MTDFQEMARQLSNLKQFDDDIVQQSEFKNLNSCKFSFINYITHQMEQMDFLNGYDQMPQIIMCFEQYFENEQQLKSTCQSLRQALQDTSFSRLQLPFMIEKIEYLEKQNDLKKQQLLDQLQQSINIKEQLKKQMTQAEESIRNNFEQQIEIIKTQKQDYQQKLQSSEKKNQDLLDKTHELQNTIQYCKQTLQILEQKEKDLTQKEKNLETQNHQLQKLIEQQKQQLSEVQGQLTSKQLDVQELEKKLSSFNNIIQKQLSQQEILQSMEREKKNLNDLKQVIMEEETQQFKQQLQKLQDKENFIIQQKQIIQKQLTQNEISNQVPQENQHNQLIKLHQEFKIQNQIITQHFQNEYKQTLEILRQKFMNGLQNLENQKNELNNQQIDFEKKIKHHSLRYGSQNFLQLIIAFWAGFFFFLASQFLVKKKFEL